MNENEFIQILIQPAKKVRFRYSSDRTRSLLNGRDGKKITVRVNTRTYSRVELYVSCVGIDEPYYPHPNYLEGERCENGFFKFELPRPCHPTDYVEHVFEKWYLICVKKTDKQELEASINVRRTFNINPFNIGFLHSDVLDVSRIRLAFQAFYFRSNGEGFEEFHGTASVVSDVVYDLNAFKDVEITDIIPTTVSFDGGTVWIMTKNVLQADATNSKVIFTLYDDNNVNIVWEKSVTPIKINKVVVVVNAPTLDINYRKANKRLTVRIVLDCLEKSSPREITYSETSCYCYQNNGPIQSKRKRAEKTSYFNYNVQLLDRETFSAPANSSCDDILEEAGLSFGDCQEPNNQVKEKTPEVLSNSNISDLDNLLEWISENKEEQNLLLMHID